MSLQQSFVCTFFAGSIRNFEISEYQSFYIWSFKILYPSHSEYRSFVTWSFYVLTPTRLDNFERPNVERPISWNLKIVNVKIWERYSIFIFTKLFFYFFLIISTLNFFSILTFQFFIIFQIWYISIFVYSD